LVKKRNHTSINYLGVTKKETSIFIHIFGKKVNCAYILNKEEERDNDCCNLFIATALFSAITGDQMHPLSNTCNKLKIHAALGI
jgi:hypothetical protein